MSRGPEALLLLLMLILPLSALLARRVPLSATLKMAAAWVGIFALAVVVVSQVDRFRGGGGDPSTTRGGTVRIARDADGHYWANARINGIERRMLVDTGASTTALTEATARAAGLNLDESNFARMVDTANGQVLARTSTAATFAVGAIETRDLSVLVLDNLGGQDLVGMNFLSRLGAWRVEGETLILEPPHDAT